ncbi:MAG: ribonuclease III domain-containing protein [Promethearchaeota archaeon]
MFDEEQEKLEKIQDFLSYRFKNIELLREALTTPKLGNEMGRTHYETFETLGDAVIKTILISKKIEEEKEKLNPEIITKTKQALENNTTLAKIAKTYFHLNQFIFYAKDQDIIGKDKKILADVLEAICGALFLDTRNLDSVERIIISRFYSDWDSLMDERIFQKSKLLEYLQKLHRITPKIIYEYESFGPDEDKYWIAKNPKIIGKYKEILYEFSIKSKPFKRKKQAEQSLSLKILKLIQNKKQG